MLLRPGPCRVLAGCYGNHAQGQSRGEEGGREMLTYAAEGERKRVTLLPCDWLQASSNPTHPTFYVISGAKLVTAAAAATAGSFSSSPRFIESLSVMLCPVCRSVTQPKDTRWGDSNSGSCMWTQRRDVGNRNIFGGSGVTDAKHTDWEERGLAEGMQTMIKVEDYKWYYSKEELLMETRKVKRPADNWWCRSCFSGIWATTTAAAANNNTANECGSERTWAGNKELSSTRTTSQLVTVDSAAERTEPLSRPVCRRVLGH